MEIREEYKLERERYLSKVMTHHEFYTWLNEKIGLNKFHLPFNITKQMLINSTDPHFRDIPLSICDAGDSLVRGKATRAGIWGWAISDSVCCLKTLARNIINEVNK